MNRTAARARAFTLIELLVVIAIVALLIGILLPGLGRARVAARGAGAAVAARSLMSSSAMYSGDHADSIIPGYLEAGTGSKVRDEFGNEWGSLISRRWVYRLAPWFDYGFLGTTLVNRETDYHRSRDEILDGPDGAFNWAYRMSVYPSFGMNSNYVGGNYAVGDEQFRRFAAVRRVGEAMRPTDMIAFASARGLAEAVRRELGFYRIEPPPLGAAFDDADRPEAFGNVHPRYADRAAAAFLDGHAGSYGAAELLDRRFWSDRAAREDDPLWEP